MEIDRYEHGVPSWVDLGTPDPAKTAEFYSALFGWTVQQGPPEAGGYAIAELRGRPGRRARTAAESRPVVLVDVRQRRRCRQGGRRPPKPQVER